MTAAGWGGVPTQVPSEASGQLESGWAGQVGQAEVEAAGAARTPPMLQASPQGPRAWLRAGAQLGGLGQGLSPRSGGHGPLGCFPFPAEEGGAPTGLGASSSAPCLELGLLCLPSAQVEGAALSRAGDAGPLAQPCWGGGCGGRTQEDPGALLPPGPLRGGVSAPAPKVTGAKPMAAGPVAQRLVIGHCPWSRPRTCLRPLAFSPCPWMPLSCPRRAKLWGCQWEAWGKGEEAETHCPRCSPAPGAPVRLPAATMEGSGRAGPQWEIPGQWPPRAPTLLSPPPDSL